MINFASTEKLGKKNSEPQMGFEPTTLRDQLMQNLSCYIPQKDSLGG